MSNLGWLMVALAVVGATIGGYILLLALRHRKLTERLRGLTEAQGRGNPPG